MIARKRRALRARREATRWRRDVLLPEGHPLKHWPVRAIIELAHRVAKTGRSSRYWTSARSRFLYGCRTGGKW